MPLVRHLTATGFIVHDDHVALHWHPKVEAWLPPGGHVETNEDPVQTVLREIEEETGLRTEVVPTGPRLEIRYPSQVPAPLTIMIEDIHDPEMGNHQHIDMIYVCRPVGPLRTLKDGWRWVSRDDLSRAVPIRRVGGPSEPPPEDVLALARHAFEIAAGGGG